MNAGHKTPSLVGYQATLWPLAHAGLSQSDHQVVAYGRSRKMRLKIAWNKIPSTSNSSDRILAKFRQYLREQGLRDGTVEPYADNAKRYLEFAKTDRPSADD